jgi:hypothetical protein
MARLCHWMMSFHSAYLLGFIFRHCTLLHMNHCKYQLISSVYWSYWGNFGPWTGQSWNMCPLDHLNYIFSQWMAGSQKENVVIGIKGNWFKQAEMTGFLCSAFVWFPCDMSIGSSCLCKLIHGIVCRGGGVWGDVCGCTLVCVHVWLHSYPHPHEWILWVI